MKKIFQSLISNLAGMFEVRDEFGMSQQERSLVLNLARKGEAGRDDAERIACTAYGLRTSQFHQLLKANEISCQ